MIDERNRCCYSTTDINNIHVTMDQLLTNYTTSLPLRVNHKGPFTYHYAVLPYVCLFSIMALVWFFVYLSILYSRHYRSKSERSHLASIYTTQDPTLAGAGGISVSNGYDV